MKRRGANWEKQVLGTLQSNTCREDAVIFGEHWGEQHI